MNLRRRRHGSRRPALRIDKDSDAVFEQAIRAGVLSDDPGKDNFAGLYMYMHHDAAGAAWFKHRETRAYVTLDPEAAEAQTEPGPKRLAFVEIGIVGTVALAGAFLVAAWLESDYPESGVGTVRLSDLTAEFIAESVRSADTPEASAQAARAWGTALENALESVAERYGVVLLPSEAVASGARDYTEEVRAAMRWASAPTGAPGDAAPGGTAYSSNAYGSNAYGETGSGADGLGEYVDVGPEPRP